MAVLRQTAEGGEVQAPYAAAALTRLALPALAGNRPEAVASTDVSLLDLVETEYGFTSDCRSVPASGFAAALARRRAGRARCVLAFARHRRPAGRDAARFAPTGAARAPAIAQQIGLAINPLRHAGRHALGLVYAAIRWRSRCAARSVLPVFFTAAEAKGFSAAIDNTAFGGIGVQLGFDDARKTWQADTVFEGSPAARARLCWRRYDRRPSTARASRVSITRTCKR